MSFDPNKPYGNVCGNCVEFPGARFEQGGKLYDVHHREVKNAAEAPAAPKPPVKEPEPEDEKLMTLNAKLIEAQAKLKSDPTPSNRAAVTKLENQIAKLGK